MRILHFYDRMNGSLDFQLAEYIPLSSSLFVKENNENFRKIRVPSNETSTIIGDLRSGARYWWTVHAERRFIRSEQARAYIDIGTYHFMTHNLGITHKLMLALEVLTFFKDSNPEEFFSVNEFSYFSAGFFASYQGLVV